MKCSLLLALACLPLPLLAQEKNRFNLPDTPAKPRFEVTDPVWPAQPGEASICLWKDDKLAALSLGVDDNNAGDIDWWKEQAKLHDFKVTWFVITGRVDWNRSVGYWKQFNELQELGHDIQSHSVTHLHVLDPDWGTPAWSYAKVAEALKAAAAAKGGAAPAASDDAEPAKPGPIDKAALQEPVVNLTPEQIARGIEWEYAQSKAQIEQHMPNKLCSALAYPGGKFTKYNDRATAAKIFRVARGARGAPNAANTIDYLSTNAMSSWAFDDQEGAWGNIYNVLDPQRYKGRYYRGWLILFSHQANKDLLAKTFAFMEENRAKFWIGLFIDVAKYGEERDTATLKTDPIESGKITFTLTDEMDDSYFNYPLTVKVRLPDAWKTVTAQQAGHPAAATLVTHEGASYALVQAIPDAGPVSLTPSK